MRVAVIAITKNGKDIAIRIKEKLKCDIFMPIKFKDDNNIIFYEDPTPLIIERLFKEYNAIVCIFSLGAVIRMISKHLKDKMSDPAIITIDDKANFVISTLSGHLGGANILTRTIADILKSTPVITTAADVNETIPVDLLGKEFGWEIEDYTNVTRVSADMVNNEPIGIYQDAGEEVLRDNLPQNVKIFDSIDILKRSGSKSYLIITNKVIDDNAILERAVLYRPKDLIVGIGLHYNTSKEDIKNGIEDTFRRYKLSLRSIKAVSTIDKRVDGLEEYCKENNLEIIYYTKEQLSKVEVPNPSEIVKRYEDTRSVAEAAALLASKGRLIVEKQKYPPNLTIAVAEV